ncbi:hypothetical protein [Sulfuricurvum sp.]|uniref:hypothetical protein n=1 Tax=Sulfuricurvum sp. TaxID=2025608 RepID=UPI0035624AB7
MSNIERFKITHNVDMMTIDRRTHKIKMRKRFHNVLTTVGLRKMAELLMHEYTDAAFSIIAIGTNSTNASSADTELGTLYSDEVATMEYEETYNAVFSHEFSFTENVSIWETGIFDSHGNMLNHAISDEELEVDSETTLMVEIVINVASA